MNANIHEFPVIFGAAGQLFEFLKIMQKRGWKCRSKRGNEANTSILQEAEDNLLRLKA